MPDGVTSITQDDIRKMSDGELAETLEKAVEQHEAARLAATEASKKADYCLSIKLLIRHEQRHRGTREPGKLPDWFLELNEDDKHD